jgi:hypothetical protein
MAHSEVEAMGPPSTPVAPRPWSLPARFTRPSIRALNRRCPPRPFSLSFKFGGRLAEEPFQLLFPVNGLG